MTNKIYEQFDNAFKYVSAYAVTFENEHIGMISIKYPKDGAGRVNAFFHIFMFEMQKGIAGGYGYDKRDSAIKSAIKNYQDYFTKNCTGIDKAKMIAALQSIDCKQCGRGDWKEEFEKAGFSILRAI